VPYEPGVLEAAVLDGGRAVGSARVETTGAPTRVALAVMPTHARPDRDDAVVVALSALDAQGRAVPTASDEVSFSLEGPGEIIGVGNGDPSSHEPDRFVPRLASREVGGWRTAALEAVPASAPRIAELEKLRAHNLDASRDATSIRTVGGIAAYWTTLQLEDADVTANALALSIGRIDDHGTVYLDGKPVAESHAWDRPVSVDLTGKLAIGEHDLVIVVKNGDGPGGLGRGIRLTSQAPASQWKRRLFSGLAQVIVRRRTGDGEIKLRAEAPGLQPAEIALPSRGGP
jgi:beta-galactosidase